MDLIISVPTEDDLPGSVTFRCSACRYETVHVKWVVGPDSWCCIFCDFKTPISKTFSDVCLVMANLPVSWLVLNRVGDAVT
jgi:hypothetical protein